MVSLQKLHNKTVEHLLLFVVCLSQVTMEEIPYAEVIIDSPPTGWQKTKGINHSKSTGEYEPVQKAHMVYNRDFECWPTKLIVSCSISHLCLVCLSSPDGNKGALSKVHVDVRDQQEWQSLQKTITAAADIQSDFYRGSLPQLTCGKSRFVLMGLFGTKEWRKKQNPFRNLTAALVEHHPAQCRKPAERRPRQPLLDWWPCTVRRRLTLIGVLLSVLLERRLSLSLILNHIKEEETVRGLIWIHCTNNKTGLKCFHYQPVWPITSRASYIINFTLFISMWANLREELFYVKLVKISGWLVFFACVSKNVASLCWTQLAESLCPAVVDANDATRRLCVPPPGFAALALASIKTTVTQWKCPV